MIAVYNDMIEHMDGMMRALATNKTQWEEDLFSALMLARLKLSKYYAEVTPTMGMLLISALILDPFRKLWSFRKWDNRMDINPEHEKFYTTQYKQAFLKYMENEYYPKQRHVAVDKPEHIPSSNLVPSAMASGSS